MLSVGLHATRNITLTWANTHETSTIYHFHLFPCLCRWRWCWHSSGDDLLDGKDSRINIRLKTMRDKNWQEKYEDLMLDMEILSEKSLRLVKEAKGVCYEHNVDEFDWNLTGEVEFIAQKYELRIP